MYLVFIFKNIFGAEIEKDFKTIEELLYASHENRNKQTEANIRKKGQEKPGIITTSSHWGSPFHSIFCVPTACWLFTSKIFFIRVFLLSGISISFYWQSV
jgi:hypothetical protein